MPSACSDRLLCSAVVCETQGLKISDRPRLVLMGSAGVGKTAIVQQFLYEKFPDNHEPTVEELHRSEYEVGGENLTLDILDTSGSYEFPAMRRLAIKTGKAFVLVYAIDNKQSFEEVCKLRDLIFEVRQQGLSTVPIVVVGNKCDLEDHREVRQEIAETVVTIDWENGFVETSAKTGFNIVNIFKTVLEQAHIHYALGKAVDRRRKSLPVQPTYPKNKSSIDQKRHSCSIQ